MTNIGKYVIAGELGVGGFGKVYKAFDPTMGRVVAIKVLNVQDEAAVKRFKAEASTSANLQHKNIVTIHDFQDEGGQQYLVMEYLDGKTLRQLLDQNIAIQPLDRLLIMAEVAEGLQYAHEHGVVHRDIKPANIMRLTDGTVKIMDFGIARLVQSNSRDTRLTQTGFIVGTIHYMAPEQFISNTADAQCDIWAYGVVFYEFLTGINPFAASSPPQVIYKITAENPAALSTHVPDLPHGLDAILKRLLARSREERYASMEDVRFDLEPVVLEMRRSQVEGLMKSVDRLMREDRLEEAHTAVRRILELDQSNLQARKWRSLLQEKIKRQFFHAHLKSVLEQAEAQVAARNYPAALELFEEAGRLDKTNPAIPKRAEEVRAEQEKSNRAAGLLAAAKQELEREAFTTAFDSAREAVKADPRNQEALGLVDQLRQTLERRDVDARRKGALSKAKGFLLVQAYDQAVELLRELAGQFPGDREVQERLAEAQRLQAAHTLRLKTDAAIAQSKDFIRQGKYQRSIEILEGLDKSVAQEPQVMELVAFAREQLQAEQRAAEVEALVRQVSKAPPADFDRSMAALDRVLELAPGDERALQLRNDLLAARKRDEENRAATQAVQECRALALGGRLEDAAARLTELKARYPGLAAVTALAGEIERLAREEQQRREREAQMRDRERTDAILARVRELASARLWDEALSELDKGMAQLPGSPGLTEERDRIRERKLAQQVVTEIQQRISRHELDSAIQAAQSALVRLPGEARIADLLQQAREQQSYQELLHRAEGLALKGELEEAGKLVSDLEKRDPEDTAVRRLKVTLEGKFKRQQDLASVDQLRRRYEFQQARDLVTRLLQEDPDDGAARALLERIQQEAIEHERRQRVAMVRTRADELCKGRKFAEAVQLLERALKEFAGDGDLQDDVRRARAAWDRDQKNDAYTRGRAELEALMKQRRFEEAIEKAQQLIAGFPDDTFLLQDLQAARSARELRDRRAQVEAEIAQLEALFRTGDAAAVRQQAEQLLAKYEEPRARELLNWANKTLAELRTIRRETAGPRSIWRWLAPVLGVVVIGFAVYEYLHQAGGGSTQLRVSPADLAFSYQAGGPVPRAGSFQLTGQPADQAWQIHGSASWFIVYPAEQIGNGAVSVQVDPVPLTPGEYSGSVMVTSKDGGVPPATVRIHMKVVGQAAKNLAEPPKEAPSTKSEPNTAVAKGAGKKTVAEVPLPPVEPLPKTISEPKSEPKTVTPPVNPPPHAAEEPIVDCHSVDYPGLPTATITWTGALPPNQSLVLNSRNVVVFGPPGQVRGSHLPGCPVRITDVSPGISATEPTPANHYAAITLRNTSSQTMTSITFKWAVK